jgi:Ras-related protein Rab-6A
MSNNNDLLPIKIILLGDTGVGKSSIIKRYIEDSFEENLSSTIGSNFLEKIEKIKGQKVRLEVWDTAGQEEFRSVTKLFVKNSKIIILVYNVTQKLSFEGLNYWYDFIQKELAQNFVLGVAGNKTDLIFEDGYDEEITSEEGKAFAEKIKANFALVSAKESGKEITNLFNQCISSYLDSRDGTEDTNYNIKLKSDNGSLSSNNKGECCMGNSKKNLKLKMVFLGCNGVGKTSIIKSIKGNKNINNLVHTKKTSKEEITYTQNGQKITVQLKDTNGDDCQNETFTKAIDKCQVIFLVFNIYKIDTLYKLEDWLKKIDTNNNKVYLLGYNNINFEEKIEENDYNKEVEKLTSKYNCEYESITIEDIYKVKAIIIDNITSYLKKINH